jgi:hypothetical protein
LRTLLAAAVTVLAIAIAAGVWALDQRGDARDAAVVAEAQRLAAEAQTAERLENALLLAARRGGAGRHRRHAQESAQCPAAKPGAARNAPLGPGWHLWTVAVSPDGGLVAVGGEGGTVKFYDGAQPSALGRAVPAPRGRRRLRTIT